MNNMFGHFYRRIRGPLVKLYRFTTLKVIYPAVYGHAAKKELRQNKVVFVEVRGEKMSDNFALIYRRLKKQGGYGLHIHFLRMGFSKKKDYFRRCLALLRDIADAKYIFLSDSSDVLSCIPIRKETVLTQLWHACGAFKKFGMSTADLIFGDDGKTLQKYPYHRNYTHVTVSSEEVVWAYEEAMSLAPGSGIVKPVGVSRTDIFFNKSFLEKAKETVFSVAPFAKGKTVILYAPTFRGHVASAQAPECPDFDRMYKRLGDSYAVLIKHHPFVENRPEIPEHLRGFAADVTGTLCIEQLLAAADICISDYSSLVFEYLLFERPMLFYAYDLDEYYDWRGFYYDYRAFVPGPIVTDTEQLTEAVLAAAGHFDKSAVRAFKEKYMGACDGHATERIMELVFGKAIQ